MPKVKDWRVTQVYVYFKDGRRVRHEAVCDPNRRGSGVSYIKDHVVIIDRRLLGGTNQMRRIVYPLRDIDSIRYGIVRRWSEIQRMRRASYKRYCERLKTEKIDEELEKLL